MNNTTDQKCSHPSQISLPAKFYEQIIVGVDQN